jgi:hypothetical protein
MWYGPPHKEACRRSIPLLRDVFLERFFCGELSKEIRTAQFNHNGYEEV